jgi:hypothetical protein
MNSMMLRRFGFSMLVGAVLLPIAIVLVLGVGELLAGMGDDAGGQALRRIALGLGILWAFDLTCLLLATSLKSLDLNPDLGENEGDELSGEGP